jgi:hypothetical protein
MDKLSVRPTKWPDRLALDVALTLEGSGETMAEVMARYEINAETMLLIGADPVFKRKVKDYRTDIIDKGLTFKVKARAQAEEYLQTSYLLIHDPSVPATVKADLIKSTVRWAGLEPKGEVVATDGGGVSITINLGDTSKDIKVIDAQPVPVDGA